MHSFPLKQTMHRFAQERHPHELVPCGVAVLMDAKTALEEPQRVLEVRPRVLLA